MLVITYKRFLNARGDRYWSYRSCAVRQRSNIIIAESHRDSYRFIKLLMIILWSPVNINAISGKWHHIETEGESQSYFYNSCIISFTSIAW